MDILPAYHYSFYVYELPDPIMRHLPAQSRLFDTPERKTRVGLFNAVYRDESRSDFSCQALRLCKIPGPDGGPKAELGLVGNPDHLFLSPDSDHGSYG